MTKINRLFIEGFKSFAKKTELQFGDAFNVVLGPNGSGKSNVMDALCFVLGRASSKSLRAEKTANLIYNGGKSKKPSTHAEVSIYFDNQAKEFPYDTKEVKVSRIVKADGQGVYRINDQKVTRHEVLELLALARIDPDGYNITLQGDIIRFVEQAAEERRILIEEIAGISTYEEKKQKALHEMEKVDEKLKEAEIVLNERNSSLKELKKEKDQAIKYKDVNKRIESSKASILHRKISDRQKAIDNFEEKIEKFTVRILTLNSDIQKHQEKIKELEAQKRGINNEIEQRGEKEQVSIHKQVEQLKVDIAAKANKIESYRNEIKRVEERKGQLQKNLDEIKGKTVELDKERKGLEQGIAQHTKELEQVEKRIAEFRKKNEMQDIERLDKEIEAAEKAGEEKDKEIQQLRQEQQELLRGKDKLEFQIQAVDERMAKVLELEKESQAQMQELKQKRVEFKKSTLELNTLINDDSQAAAQLGKIRSDLDQVEGELIKITARQSSLQEFASTDNALKKLLESKDKFGVHGTIAELGKVSDKYALALEIAAANKIKSIVTDDDKSAAECIKYLKANKFGIATFIPMNKIKATTVNEEMKRLEKQQGVHGFAVDLVTFQPKYKTVFSYVFGDTLVVENIDVARRIGIGTVKMVTLDGDIAERSGAMQGGYRQKERNAGFKQAEMEEKLEALEERKADLQAMLARLQKQREGSEERVQRLRELKANLEGDIIKLEKTLHLEEGDTEASKTEKKDLKEQLKGIDAKFDAMQARISEANKILADIKIKKQEHKARISQLRNPALIAELNAFEQKRSELKENIAKTNAELSGNEAKVKNILGPEFENITKIIKSHEKEQRDFEAEIKRLEAEVKADEKDLVKKEEDEQKFMKQFKDLFAKQKKIEEEMKEREAKIAGLRESVHAEEQSMNELKVTNAQVLTEYNTFKQEFAQYAEKEIELIQKPIADLEQDLRNAERSMIAMGSINMKALEIYETVEKEYNSLVEKKQKLESERQDVMLMMNEIETKKKELFMGTFDLIAQHFADKFKQLSRKGEAVLVLENKENPFEGGVLVRVRIQGNRYMDIRSLSGGEKTLTALAFIFCIQEFEPAPFYVMDEVDAALDKDNSDKLSKFIREYSNKSQYVVISHNDALITEADTLYGVSMNEDGISTVVSLKL